MSVDHRQSAAVSDSRPKRGMIYLLIAIPAASVLMGILTLYIVFDNPDPDVRTHHVPLSKTSWEQGDGSDR